MSLYNNCITSQEVKNLKPQDMDDYDYNVCKKWLNLNKKLKTSRFANLIITIPILSLGIFVNSLFLTLLVFPIGIQSINELTIKKSTFVELKRNKGLKRMQELVDYYQNIKCKNLVLEYKCQNSSQKANPNLMETSYYKQTKKDCENLKDSKQQYIEKYLSNIEDCRTLDD